MSAFARPAARYLAALAAFAILAFAAVRQVRIETDFSAFLPPTASAGNSFSAWAP